MPLTKIKKGFTIIEMASVISLGLLILILTYQIFLVSSNIYYKSDATLELAQNGRVLLDRLSRELRQSNDLAVTTTLPISKDIPGSPPPDHLMFENGHITDSLQYINYYLDQGQVHRQVIIYYFPQEPNNYVHFNVLDQNNNPPQNTILEDRVIAENFSNLIFYGSDNIIIEATLTKNGQSYFLSTVIQGRNIHS